MKRNFVYIILILLLLCLSAKGEDRDFLPESTAQQDTSKTTFPDISPDYIINKTIESAPQYHNLIEEYTANLYTKGYINIKKSNILINYVPTMFKPKKGIKEYITESYSELHYTSPYIFDRKIKAYHGTIDKVKSFNDQILDYFDVSIYSNSVFDVKLISPLSYRAKKFYKYKIDSVYYDEHGKHLYHISFTPKYSSYQLISGYIKVYDSTWKIREFRYNGRSEYLNYTNKIQMGQDTSLPEELLPLKFDASMSFRFLGNVFEGHFTADMDYESITLKDNNKPKVDKKSRYDLTSSFTLRSDTSTFITTDSSYFAKLRPFSLSEKEQSIYEMYYNEKENVSIKNKEEAQKSVFWGNVGDILVGSPKFGRVRFSPILNPLLLSYSGRNGVSYKQIIRYQRNLFNNKLLKITPMVGYNFKYNELYWNVPVSFEYMPEKMGSFVFDIGNGNRIYNSEILEELKAIPDSTFNFDMIKLDYFRDFYADIFHSIEISNGLSVDVGISVHHRKAVEAYDFNKKKQPVEADNNLDNIRNIYNSFAPHIKISWTPMQYYYRSENSKINIYSRWPTFSLDYERGIEGLLKNSGKFERIEFDMQHNISLGHLRNLYYRTGAGVFTNKEDMFFVAFKNFSKNNLPSGWNDDIGGTFQNLDRRWYNASREYIRANLTYEAPFLMIPYIFKSIPNILNERLYFGVLVRPYRTPYVELGYGIGTHIFDFGAFVSSQKSGKFYDTGIKLTIELFNR